MSRPPPCSQKDDMRKKKEKKKTKKGGYQIESDRIISHEQLYAFKVDPMDENTMGGIIQPTAEYALSLLSGVFLGTVAAAAAEALVSAYLQVILAS